MTGPFSMRMGRPSAPPALRGKQPLRLPTAGSRALSRALREAQEALSGGDGAKALAALEPVAAQYPTHPHLLIHLGRAHAAAGDLERAVVTLFKAKEHSANNPIVDLFLGQAFLRHERFDDAEASFRRVLETDRKNALAANYLALALFRAGKHGEAFREWKRAGWSHNLDFLVEFTMVFERFLLEAPELPEIERRSPPAFSPILVARPPMSGWAAIRRGVRIRRLLGKAESLLASQKTADALGVTNEALALQPDSQDALLLQAVALYELGRHREAAQRLMRILREESSMLARCFLAFCLLRLGAVEIAEDMLARIRPEGPFDYYLHYHMGLCRLIRGDAAGARKFFGVAYREYFIDSREYCFEYLVQKAQAAAQRRAEARPPRASGLTHPV